MLQDFVLYPFLGPPMHHLVRGDRPIGDDLLFFYALGNSLGHLVSADHIVTAQDFRRRKLRALVPGAGTRPVLWLRVPAHFDATCPGLRC